MSLDNGFNKLASRCFEESSKAGWWDVDHNSMFLVPTKLCLIHSEVSEAMEAYRKDLQDDKLPHRKGVEVELADAIIRIADLAGYLGLDIGGAIEEKIEFNKTRIDHKKEVRESKGGKAF